MRTFILVEEFTDGMVNPQAPLVASGIEWEEEGAVTICHRNGLFIGPFLGMDEVRDMFGGARVEWQDGGSIPGAHLAPSDFAAALERQLVGSAALGGIVSINSTLGKLLIERRDGPQECSFIGAVIPSDRPDLIVRVHDALREIGLADAPPAGLVPA